MCKNHIVSATELSGCEVSVVIHICGLENLSEMVRIRVSVLAVVVQVQYLGDPQKLQNVELAIGVDVQASV